MPPNPLPHYFIESASPLSAPQGKLKLQGWVAGLVESGMRVRLRLSPDLCFTCRSGLDRPDVAAAYPELSGAQSGGFLLETYIPPGLHLATLEYQVAERDAWVPFHSLSINAELSPLVANLESSLPISGSGSSWLVHGWCFHPQFAIETLTVQFAHLETAVSARIPRPDVAEAFPQFTEAATSGFSGRLALEPGHGPVRLTARLANRMVLQQVVLANLEIPDQRVAEAERNAARIRALLVKLPKSEQPEVSIVIPIYNQLDLTLGCLESLVRHAGDTPFEVIIVDDNSTLLVRDTLSQVAGIRLLPNNENQGFVLNCNRGAQAARGKFVLFLNNDTEVTSGWLKSMINVFREHPLTGAVGAKLVYPDGRLQEAGGILWEDASGINYGKGDDPERPEYNYLRQVDYCSGACLLVPRDLFLTVGGFDPLYRPAYYEDADLAFALRSAGRVVYYQPAARIIHFEGASSGTDTRTGIKKHQAINQAKFEAKWASELKGHGIDASLQHAARDRYAKSRILVIDACALTPDADSGSLRMFNLLRMLAQQGAKVTFAAENLQAYEPYSTQLRLAGIEHLTVPHVFNLPQYLESHGYAFDVIILSRKHIAHQFLETVRRVAPEARIIFDTVDLMFLRLERQAEHEASPTLRLEAAKCKETELSLCEKSDIVFVVSPVEAELLALHIPKKKIALVSNIHRLYPSRVPFEARQGIMFVGGFQHPPNVDAIDFFLDEVLPLMRPRLPGLKVHIVGSNMPDRWQSRADRNTHLHGFVPDLIPLYEQVRLAIAPLRYGAGVKGKVNQSMAHGVPVVATTMATEGMHLVDGQDVLVADDASGFADAVVRLHEDRELWSRIARGGLSNIERHFSFAAVENELLAALGPDLLAGGPHRVLPRRPAASYELGEVLKFGRTENARKYTREGWSEPEDSSCWMVGTRAVIEMELPEADPPSRIHAVVYPFLAGSILPRQRLGLAINGRPLPTGFLVVNRAEPFEAGWEIPSEWLRGKRSLVITFHSPDATAPRSLGASSDERRLSFAFLKLDLSR